MADQVLRDGDTALFEPAFGAAIVIVRPGILTASGTATIGGRRACVQGDEGTASVPGCVYTTAQHSIPGVGTLRISSLADDQQATRTRTRGTALLLAGGRFEAEFQVQAPAQQPQPLPAPPTPDATASYSGRGKFLGTNQTVKGT